MVTALLVPSKQVAVGVMTRNVYLVPMKDPQKLCVKNGSLEAILLVQIIVQTLSIVFLVPHVLKRLPIHVVGAIQHRLVWKEQMKDLLPKDAKIGYGRLVTLQENH